MEQLKVEIMVQTSCSIWPVDSSDELGKVIARLTKAVAERPFKYFTKYYYIVPILKRQIVILEKID